MQHHFTENHGALETKTYQQNCCRKMQSFTGSRKVNFKQMCGRKLRRSQEYSVTMDEKQGKVVISLEKKCTNSKQQKLRSEVRKF